MAATYPITAAYLAGQRRPQPRGEHPSRPRPAAWWPASARRPIRKATGTGLPSPGRTITGRAQRRTSITAAMNARTPPAT